MKNTGMSDIKGDCCSQKKTSVRVIMEAAAFMNLRSQA